MFRIRLWLFAACMLASGATLAGTACANFYVGGGQPSLAASLTSRTTEVCHTEYVLMASGITKGSFFIRRST